MSKIKICYHCKKEFSESGKALLCPECRKIRVEVRCIQCGKKIKLNKIKSREYLLGREKKKFFCSKSCAGKWSTDHMTLEPKICEHCKKEYIPTGVRQRFCEDCMYGTDLKIICSECNKKFIPNKKARLKFLNNGYEVGVLYFCSKQCEHTSGGKRIEKIKQYYIDTYGVTNPSYIPSVKEKRKQTYINRTGYDHPSKNPEVWKKYVQSREINGNRSGSEIKFEELLKKHKLKPNKDFIAEYLDDKRYPFFCDFYIPAKDLFIELNLFPTHNIHWYNKRSDKDAKILKEWKIKAKTSDFYKDMVQTWTIRDPKKREYARKNNLNYVVLWTQKDIENWFKDGMPIRKDWK